MQIVPAKKLLESPFEENNRLGNSDHGWDKSNRGHNKIWLWASKLSETKLAWDKNIDYQYLDKEKDLRTGWYPG